MKLPEGASLFSAGPWAKDGASLGLSALLCEVGTTADMLPRAAQRRVPSPLGADCLGSPQLRAGVEAAAGGWRDVWGERGPICGCSPSPAPVHRPPLPPARTSHMRLLFLQMSTCSGAMTRPVKGPISVPALIHVLEKMPRPSPGMELCAMITSAGSTRLDSF